MLKTKTVDLTQEFHMYLTSLKTSEKYSINEGIAAFQKLCAGSHLSHSKVELGPNTPLFYQQLVDKLLSHWVSEAIISYWETTMSGTYPVLKHIVTYES